MKKERKRVNKTYAEVSELMRELAAPPAEDVTEAIAEDREPAMLEVAESMPVLVDVAPVV